MDEGFASPTGIAWRGNTGVVEYGGGDRNMVVMFYYRATHNAAKSAQHGSPQFEDRVFVRIHPPGERLNIIDREANDQDKRRFPVQWAQFQQNKEQHPDGTPIDLLYPDQPSVASALRANGVHTIETCADLSAPAIENIGMGAQRYVNDAKKYVEMAGKGVAHTQMRRELEERDRTIRTLETALKQLQSRLANLEQSRQAIPDLAQVQALLAGVMQRPVHMPNQAFDVQTAQINATRLPTTTQGRPGRRAKPSLRG